MDDRRKPMTPFAAMIFDSLTQANRAAVEKYRREGPPPIIGYAIEMPADWPHPSILVCTKPTCQPGNPENIQERIPLTQADIDFLALTHHKAQHCESCGDWLSTHVKGPDPRD